MISLPPDLGPVPDGLAVVRGVDQGTGVEVEHYAVIAASFLRLQVGVLGEGEVECALLNSVVSTMTGRNSIGCRLGAF